MSQQRAFLAYHDDRAEPLAQSQASEANHRIGNNLALLAGAIRYRARHLSEEARMMSSDEVSRILDDISSRVVTVGQLHRSLSAVPGGEHIDINRHVFDLCVLLIDTLAEPGQFELHQTSHGPCLISAARIMPVCLIVSEIVTNALKYAHPTGAPGKLMIGCRCEDEEHIVIEIADDGVGLPDGFRPETDGGVGLRTIAMLARQLHGEVRFVSRPLGLSVTLRVPVARVH